MIPTGSKYNANAKNMELKRSYCKISYIRSIT